MKKIIAVLLVACVVASGVFAAGGKDSGKDQAVTTATLTVGIWDKNQEPGLTKILQDFTALTGIKATIQVTPWDQYWTMLEASATGGALPDVFWMHSNEFAKYASNGMLLDVTSKASSSKIMDISKHPKEIVNLYTWNKKLYAIPKDIDTIALWYNKTMFDQAGLAYPDASWTWDTFRAAAKKLTKADGSQYGFTLKTSNNQAGWYNIVYDMGGEIISADKKKSGFDKPGTIKAIEYVTSLISDGSMPPYAVISENGEETLFESGKVAMVTMGSWMLPDLCNNDYVKQHGDIAVLPKDAVTGRRISIYNGLGWAAASNTKNKEAAWALMEYLGSKEAQQKQSDLGIVISSYEGTTKNWVSAYPKFNLKAYLDMTNDMVIRPYSNATVKWENMVSEKLVDVWTRAKSPVDVCKDITKLMNTYLAEE